MSDMLFGKQYICRSLGFLIHILQFRSLYRIWLWDKRYIQYADDRRALNLLQKSVRFDIRFKGILKDIHGLNNDVFSRTNSLDFYAKTNYDK